MTTTLPTVDTETLDTVTGGIITGTGTFGSSNLQFQQLQSLLNSLQNGNGGCHHNDGEMSPLTMMMFAMALRNSEGPRVEYLRPAVWF
jgi:hypothetical protein